MQFSPMSKFTFSHCLCLSLSLSLQCSGSFYSTSGKKKGCSYISLTDFCIEELQLAFRDDMESVLPLNEENWWIAVGKEVLKSEKNFRRKDGAKLGNKKSAFSFSMALLCKLFVSHL